MSAEVPKLRHRLLLADPGFSGDRPPAEIAVTLADPGVLLPSSSVKPPGGQPLIDDRAMAFPALHRFEYV